MLANCLSVFGSSFKRFVPTSLSPMKRHSMTSCKRSKSVGCPSIFTTTTVHRKLSHLEEGRKGENEDSDGKKPQRPSIIERLKLGWRKYGILGVTTYCVLYMTTLSQIYFCLHHDVFNTASIGMDPPSIRYTKGIQWRDIRFRFSLKRLLFFCTFYAQMSHTLEALTGIDDISTTVQQHPQIGTLLLSYVVNQFTEPIRVAALVYILPRLANYFHKAIWLR